VPDGNSHRSRRLKKIQGGTGDDEKKKGELCRREEKELTNLPLRGKSIRVLQTCNRCLRTENLKLTLRSCGLVYPRAGKLCLPCGVKKKGYRKAEFETGKSKQATKSSERVVTEARGKRIGPCPMH